MTGIYSTEDLISILAEERKACLSGKRLNLTVSPSGISPFIDQFLTTDGIQKFTAYNDFRATVHQYQQAHHVSGVVWQTLTVRHKTLHYPKVHDQLMALPTDLDLLRSTKASVLAFWHSVTQTMDLYLSLNGGKAHQPITTIEVGRMAQRSEWASLCQQGQLQDLELILQLGWGQPEAATYRRGPESGSDYIHAVQPGNRPLG